MRVLVTGSAGHLGEALMRVLPDHGVEPVGLDLKPSPFTQVVGSIQDRALVREAMAGADGVIHAATLHKPHVATHSKQAFIDANISGTLCLLEEAVAAGVGRFVFTSTTSAFGAALTPGPDAPAAWIDESVVALPKNIYGATKTAAEDLCALFALREGLNCAALRVSRFFPEDDDDASTSAAYVDANAKTNEFLFRRVDIEDAVLAHVCALRRAPDAPFGRYIISAPSPFRHEDLAALRREPARVVAGYYPRFEEIYRRIGYRMFDDIGRVYVSAKAQADLAWRPRYDFGAVLAQLEAGDPIGSALARTVGKKGYHDQVFENGPYPVE